MATTGELPPSARAGQAFIHDPKVADVTEVKAQIKLRFRDVRAQPCVVTRSFQLTQKTAGKLEKKDLDQVIQTLDDKTGERVSVSRKCADINATVPDMMGVSKAILENVVFVHQEESNWPLGEAATLKKKFDEIFSATKYTKALEHINKLKKEQNQKIKEFRLMKDTLRVKKDHAVKLRKRHDEDKERARAVMERMRALEAEMKEAEARLKDAHEQLEAARTAREKRGRLRARREAIQAENAKRRMNVDNEMTDSTEELVRFREEFEEKIAARRRELGTVERDINDARLEIAALEERRERDVRAHGKLSAEAEAHAKRVVERAEFLVGVAERFPEIGPAPDALVAAARRRRPSAAAAGAASEDDPQSESESLAAANALKSRALARLDELRAAADALKAKHREEDDAKGAEAEAANRKLAAAEEAARLRAERRDAQRARANHIAEEMAAHAVSDEAIEDLRRRCAEAERLFEERRAAGAAAAAVAELDKVAEETDAVDRRLARLRAEQDRAATAGENATKVRLKREELFQKEERLRALLDSKLERFRGVFGGEAATPAAAELKPRLAETLANRAAAAESARRAASSAAAERDAATTALNAAKAARDKARAEAARAASAAEAEGDLLPAPAATGGDGARFAGYEDAAKETEETLKEAEETLTVTDNLDKVYSSVAAHGRNTHQCPVCLHGLEDPAGFEGQIAKHRENLPEHRRDAEARAVELRRRRAKLRELAPHAARYAALHATEIPEAERAVSDAEGRVEAATGAAGAAAEAEASAVAAHAAAAAVAEDADQVTRLALETGEIRDAVAELERAFGGASQFTQPGASVPGGGAALGSQPATRAPSAIAADVEEAESRRAALLRERDAQARRKERANAELVSLERDARDLREEHMRVSARAEKRLELKRELADIERDEREGAAEAARLEAERAPHRERSAALALERSKAREAASAAEAAADAETRALQRDVDAMDARDGPIAEYAKNGDKAAALEKTRRDVAATDEKIEARRARRAALEAKEKQAAEVLKSQDKIFRSICDNVALREGEEEVKRLDEELERSGGGGDGDGEGSEMDGLQATLKQHAAAKNALFGEYAESQGRVRAHQEAMEQCKRELDDPELKGVDKNLSRRVLELKTLEMVNGDLDRYHSALDRALMAFHASKMSDINKVVRELWQRTYRGQDIDYIQIRSDAEGAQGRSSYNYRVVMVVGDAELEMRGRCSAGQKVLACLIIRLALAETFCLNCGILALDEPTTNLDAPNADALARSLIDVMHSRKDQENFQLIVITHDMHFAQVLGQREHADYYWRITKDDNQHSHIECENIYE